jgi:stringent starvation protein B
MYIILDKERLCELCEIGMKKYLSPFVLVKVDFKIKVPDSLSSEGQVTINLLSSLI